MAGLQYYDFTLAPNQTRELAAEGQYFRYYSGSAGGADETILIKSDTGGVQTMLRPGQSIKTPTNCRTWYLSNYKNTGTITGIAVVGNGEIQDSNVSGTVAVINGELQRVKAGNSFVYGPSIAPTAGQYTHHQLWNPVASGKNLILNKLSWFSGAINTTVLISKPTVQLANLQSNGFSKMIGGNASVGQLRNENNAAIQGTTMGFTSSVNAYESKEFMFSEPFVISPGNGVNLICASINTQIWAFIQWNEENQ